MKYRSSGQFRHIKEKPADLISMMKKASQHSKSSALEELSDVLEECAYDKLILCDINSASLNEKNKLAALF